MRTIATSERVYMLEKAKALTQEIMENDSKIGQVVDSLESVNSLLTTIELQMFDSCNIDTFRMQFADMKNLHMMAKMQVRESIDILNAI